MNSGISGQLAARIRRRIERGALVPGQRLSQREIAETYAVSATPVREAFHILQAQGFLRIDHHRGAVVAHPTPEEIREIYDMRKALEALAVRRAIPHLDGGALERLERLQERMRWASTRDERAELNGEFHQRLYAAARMPRLAATIAQFRATISYYVEAAYEAPDDVERAAQEHRHILDACRAGDGARAAAAITEQLERTARVAVASAERMRSGDVMLEAGA